MAINADIQLDKKYPPRLLIKQLGELPKAVGRRIQKSTIRKALRPTLVAARKGVPRESGALRASLGTTVNRRKFKGAWVGKVWPRAKFTYTAKATKDADGNRVKGAKSKPDISAQRRGHPRTYASYIEEGDRKLPKKGGWRPKGDADKWKKRPSGGAHFLRNAYYATKSQAVEIFRKDVFEAIKNYQSKVASATATKKE